MSIEIVTLLRHDGGNLSSSLSSKTSGYNTASEGTEHDGCGVLSNMLESTRLLRRVSDLPVQIGRVSVKADKLRAKIHVIVSWFAVSTEKTPLVCGSRDTSFTQMDSAQLFANTAARATSTWSQQAPRVPSDTTYCQDVTEATWHLPMPAFPSVLSHGMICCTASSSKVPGVPRLV